MRHEDRGEPVQAEPADPGPGLRQVLLLLRAGARDGRQAGGQQGLATQLSQDSHAQVPECRHRL